MSSASFWCSVCVFSVILAFAAAAPPERTKGNPHPFYETPYPQEEMGEKEGFGSPSLKRNPAPPEDCTACCQDLWCSYINTRCLCSPQWNIGP
ncbi:unnamed protein product [Porites evermanni]|uniref:Uncharacterized protein n=1 Tax=Porites evermanni TaxID=104178 RepID=A0ABN8SBK6_9CNID|nr:unnamed protein product [Porites evermanni]